MRPPDRRKHARVRSRREHGITTIRVRPGIQATLVDLSSGGAALETERRLLPGRFVHVQLAGSNGIVTGRAKVVRTVVSCLTAGLIVYRCAVQFDREVLLELAAGPSLESNERGDT